MVAGVLIALVLMRADTGLLVNLLLTGIAAALIYILFRRTKGMRLVVMYLVAFGVFDQIRALAAQTGVPVNFGYAIDGDKHLFGVVPALWLQQRFYRPDGVSLVDVGASAVYLSYFVVVHLFALWIWLNRRQRFTMYAGTVLLAFYLGLVVFFLLPTAPPWFASQHGYLPAVHRVFRELVGQFEPATYDAGSTVAGVNDVAAMPSLHMAITVVVAIYLWQHGRLLGLVGMLYVVSMGFALVYLGEHYVSDEIAGVVLAFVSWQLARTFWKPDPTILEAMPFGSSAGGSTTT